MTDQSKLYRLIDNGVVYEGIRLNSNEEAIQYAKTAWFPGGSYPMGLDPSTARIYCEEELLIKVSDIYEPPPPYDPTEWH